MAARARHLALIGGVYLWNQHENGIERAVHARLRERGIAAHRVSCSKDHEVATRVSAITYYRCEVHGGDQQRRNGLVPAGEEVCVPFVGERPATEAEVRVTV